MKTKIEIDKSEILELLEEISSLSDSRDWHLSFGQIQAIIPFEKTDFYRFLYSRSKYDLFNSIDTDGFNEENLHVLIEFLSETRSTEISNSFYHAGYYFSESDLSHWVEFFTSVSMSKIQNHKIDEELFDISMAGCSSRKVGIEFYIDSIIDINDLIKFAIPIYLAKYKVENNGFSQKILKNHIQYSIKSRIIKIEYLYSRLSEKLSYKFSNNGSLSGPEEVLELDNAINEFLSKVNKGRAEKENLDHLKVRYKSLMKKFHPDVNPNGSALSKKLNEIYSKIQNITI